MLLTVILSIPNRSVIVFVSNLASGNGGLKIIIFFHDLLQFLDVAALHLQHLSYARRPFVSQSRTSQAERRAMILTVFLLMLIFDSQFRPRIVSDQFPIHPQICNILRTLKPDQSSGPLNLH